MYCKDLTKGQLYRLKLKQSGKTKIYYENYKRKHGVMIQIKSKIYQKIRRFNKNKKWLLKNYHRFDILLNDEIFNGLMLSDGSLDRVIYKNSRFVLGQSVSHKELIFKTQEHFMDLGIDSSIKLMFNKKSETHWYYFYTGQRKTFTMLRKIWYPNGKKIVPNYIKVTPKLLAYWFMGDGSSSWHSKSTSRISLYTHAFPLKDTTRLSKMLLEIGIYNLIREVKKDQFIIEVKRTKSVDKFYEIVEPYIINSFKYKLKKKKIDGRILTRGMHKSPETEFKKGIHYSPKTEFKKGHKPLNHVIRSND